VVGDRGARGRTWPALDGEVPRQAREAVRRGEVWWARLPLPAGRRPVVLISRDEAYAVRAKVTVAEVSTRVRALSCEVRLSARDGMPRACVINADNLATIPKACLESRIVTLDPKRLVELDAALRFSLALG
jgi:mRNA interferase MazF